MTAPVVTERPVPERLTAQQLLDLTLDDGSFVRWDAAPVPVEADERYAADLERARERSGLDEAVIAPEHLAVDDHARDPAHAEIAGALSRVAKRPLHRVALHRGGERAAAAAGINEVRFFHPEDQQCGGSSRPGYHRLRGFGASDEGR